MGTLGQLNTNAFRTAFLRVGKVPVKWLQRVGPCPRHGVGKFGFDPLTEAACTLCNNNGQLYREMTLPVNGASKGKLMLHQATEKGKRSPVQLIQGDIQCSFYEDDYPLGDGDRVSISNRPFSHSEKLKRGTGAGDPLRYFPANKVKVIYGESGIITTGFALSANGRQITWSAWPGGTHYTANYEFLPTYFVVEGSVHHRETATNGDLFPSSCVLRLWQNNNLDVKDGL